LNTDIRIEVSFLNHRKRKRLIRLIGIGATHYLVNLWITACLEAPDGVLRGWDEKDIAEAAQWPEDATVFVDALMQCGSPNLGFIEKNGDGVYRLHDWPEHQSWVIHAPDRSAQARKASAIRWGNSRQSVEDAGSNAPSIAQSNTVSNAPILSVPLPSPILSNKPPTPLNKGEQTLFDRFWAAYPRKQGKGDAERAFKKFKVTDELLTTMLSALEQYKESPQWTDDNGKYIPSPAKWLNGKRWTDEIRKSPTWP